MSSDTPAVAALILVPIAIAGSAAYVALKTSHLYKRASRAFGCLWNSRASSTRSHRQVRKLRRSNISSSQTYADSWLDLESIAGDETRIDTFINQTPCRANIPGSGSAQESACRIWHPNREARLAWSFANPRSLSPNPFESSNNVVRPLPVVQRPERLSTEDVEFLLAPKRVEEAHQ
jgi:hypothetical protein